MLKKVLKPTKPISKKFLKVYFLFVKQNLTPSIHLTFASWNEMKCPKHSWPVEVSDSKVFFAKWGKILHANNFNQSNLYIQPFKKSEEVFGRSTYFCVVLNLSVDLNLLFPCTILTKYIFVISWLIQSVFWFLNWSLNANEY